MSVAGMCWLKIAELYHPLFTLRFRDKRQLGSRKRNDFAVQNFTEKRLVLLKKTNGFFRPLMSTNLRSEHAQGWQVKSNFSPHSWDAWFQKHRGGEQGAERGSKGEVP